MNIKRRGLIVAGLLSVPLFGTMWAFRAVESEGNHLVDGGTSADKSITFSSSKVASQLEPGGSRNRVRQKKPQKLAGLLTQDKEPKPTSWRKVFSDLDEKVINEALSNSIDPRQEYVYGSDKENWLELGMVENFTDAFEPKRQCRHLLEQPGQCSWKTKLVLHQEDPSAAGSQIAAVSAEITSSKNPECDRYVSCYLEKRWSSKSEFPALKQEVQAIEFENTQFVSEENPSGRGLITENRLKSQKQSLAQCEGKLKQFEEMKKNDPRGEGGNLDRLEHVIRSTRQRCRISRDLLSFLSTALEHAQAEKSSG